MEPFPLGGTGVLWVNLSFERKDEAPTQLLHKLTIDSTNQFGGKQTYINEAAPISIDLRPPVLVSPPLHGGRWFVSGGYKGKLGHRRALFAVENGYHCAQRYAIDWILFTPTNRLSNGDAMVCKNWPTYEQPVYAVADATVTGVIDRFDDQKILAPQGNDRLAYPGGNSITLDIGGGNYAFYAHLKRGSIKVKEGDRIKKGHVLGLAGNSGNSSGPHLHFHITDSPSPIASDGIPYAFDSFKVDGEVKDLGAMEKLNAQGKAQLVEHSNYEGQHRDELPTEGMLLTFPD